MLRSNPLLWPKSPAIWSYGIAVFLVTTALILTQWPTVRLESAPVSLFLLAVMFSAWLGGVAPGLLATVLSALAFYYYFLPPLHSFAAKPAGIPRLISFAVSLVLVGLLSAAQRTTTESLRRARDDLMGTVQRLQRTNEALQAESHERKRAEEKTQRSQAYLSAAQRLSHTGSFGWRSLTGEIFLSEETFRIFQYDPTTKPTFELALQRVHPEDAAVMRETIERASKEGKDFEHEYRLLMPDGAVKHVHVVAHAERDESGEIEFVGSVMDVSDRKHAEEELRQSEALAEQRLRLVVDTTPAMLNTLRPDGYLDYVNKGWLDYFGLSLETALDRADVMKMSVPSEADMYGGVWQPIIHPEDLPGFTEKWKSMLVSGKPGEREARVRRFDGVYRWHLFRAVPFRDEAGKVVKWYASAFDIEDRKNAEEALRRSECYLAEAQRFTHTGSWAWRVERRDAVHLSEEWYRIYGFDPEKGPPDWEQRLQRAHPEDRAKWQWSIDRAIAEKSDYEVEFRIVLPDGTVKHIYTVGHPVLNASGELTEFVGSATDITERRQAEEALRQAQADLAHVSRVTTMGELTASLAHEVKQPITAASTNATTCLRWLAGDTPNIEEARAAAKRIVTDGKRAAEIISRIRRLFKKGPPELEAVDVNEVIREMTVMLRSEAMRYSISVRTELAPDLPQVMGDRVQLQQVLMNLMINGIEAMKEVDGTRELGIKSQRGENEQLLVSVSDTGIGLPPQQADQIFNAFFTTKPHGTGMGLRISRSILESHGGRLWAANNSSRGASFYLALPAKGTRAAKAHK